MNEFSVDQNRPADDNNLQPPEPPDIEKRIEEMKIARNANGNDDIKKLREASMSSIAHTLMETVTCREKMTLMDVEALHNALKLAFGPISLSNGFPREILASYTARKRKLMAIDTVLVFMHVLYVNYSKFETKMDIMKALITNLDRLHYEIV